ncbi:MAG: DUF5067 domain-containing protein [Lachnospiraceae bacterium]|nr:DUF5067 domain-containing protein [Lachnospiraceae bacterium]
MNDFNSRYRNIDDQPSTIRTNASGYGPGYDMGYGDSDMDIMEQENAQKKKQVARASQARGTSRGRKSKRAMLIYSIIIALEIVALVVIWVMYFTYDSKLSKGGSNQAAAESSEGGNSGNINVENENFSLACTKISITTDATGNPVAVVYFTFANKTENPLSMSQVYNPTFKQAGMDLPTATSLAEQPVEISNKDMQVSNGQPIDCAYAVTLQDTTSEISITMHDNYETFSDIGTTVVPIS